MFLNRALKKVISKKRYNKKIYQYWDINSNYSFMLEDAICVSENFWQFDTSKKCIDNLTNKFICRIDYTIHTLRASWVMVCNTLDLLTLVQ